MYTSRSNIILNVTLHNYVMASRRYYNGEVLRSLQKLYETLSITNYYKIVVYCCYEVVISVQDLWFQITLTGVFH